MRNKLYGPKNQEVCRTFVSAFQMKAEQSTVTSGRTKFEPSEEQAKFESRFQKRKRAPYDSSWTFEDRRKYRLWLKRVRAMERKRPTSVQRRRVSPRLAGKLAVATESDPETRTVTQTEETPHGTCATSVPNGQVSSRNGLATEVAQFVGTGLSRNETLGQDRFVTQSEMVETPVTWIQNWIQEEYPDADYLRRKAEREPFERQEQERNRLAREAELLRMDEEIRALENRSLLRKAFDCAFM